MATSEWLQFFQDAGIPPGPALGYAVAFVDNRIHKNMLLDLTKELMKELGITVVGDVIAILRHAKVVHRQEMCRAASESLQPEGAGGAERSQGVSRRDQDPRDPRDPREPRDQRPRNAPGAPQGAAGRMITNSLSRDSNPRRARNPPGAGISVTVPNGAAACSLAVPTVPTVPAVPAKRRRVTAEMEGKYVISLPKGTTARTRKILQLQAARGPGRTSVFERLGAEGKAAAAAAGKPSGVFSRLGDSPDPSDSGHHPGDSGHHPGDSGHHPGDSGHHPGDGDPEALPYAGVLKKRRDCPPAVPAAQDGAVSSSVSPELRPGAAWGCGKVSSSCGSGSVFRRLGRKPD